MVPLNRTYFINSYGKVIFYLRRFDLRLLCRESNYSIKQGLVAVLAKSSDWAQATLLNYKLHKSASLTLKGQ
jgi:hypothetical protein